MIPHQRPIAERIAWLFDLAQRHASDYASAEAWLREDPYVQQGVFARTTVRPFRKTLP